MVRRKIDAPQEITPSSTGRFIRLAFGITKERKGRLRKILLALGVAAAAILLL